MSREELDAELFDLRRRFNRGDQNVTPIRVINFIARELDVPVGEAKGFFAFHPAWADVHEAAQPLHDAAEAALTELAKPSD